MCTCGHPESAHVRHLVDGADAGRGFCTHERCPCTEYSA